MKEAVTIADVVELIKKDPKVFRKYGIDPDNIDTFDCGGLPVSFLMNILYECDEEIL